MILPWLKLKKRYFAAAEAEVGQAKSRLRCHGRGIGVMGSARAAGAAKLNRENFDV